MQVVWNDWFLLCIYKYWESHWLVKKAWGANSWIAGFWYWLSYEDNGDLKSRSEISNGELVYELPDEFKDLEDDEDDGEN